MARRALRWTHRSHGDYVRASVLVVVPDRRAFVGYLQVQAHRLRTPPKVSFSLVYRHERILGLDVEPGHFHRNLMRESVNATHWQVWPKMDAEADTRKLTYGQWFSEFLKRAKISYHYPLASPPHGIQLGLDLK